MQYLSVLLQLRVWGSLLCHRILLFMSDEDRLLFDLGWLLSKSGMLPVCFSLANPCSLLYHSQAKSLRLNSLMLPVSVLFSSSYSKHVFLLCTPISTRDSKSESLPPILNKSTLLLTILQNDKSKRTTTKTLQLHRLYNSRVYTIQHKKKTVPHT